MYTFLHTKEGLILSTIEVINEQSFLGLPTREVVKKQMTGIEALKAILKGF
ncbi:hypothetical protein [Desulfosporosinus hippei]|uniref:Uncharacterized protein n=1 Tax=Desulfosporosinus hippei DSM 8344 TaxID=1121419 RepID=A0A1G7W8Z1_9FIRM|nr:hypothetical protein [Desulfosporosinus hippei]SDG68408.1 hypothetical protein SAMN05443529_10568 [Desulfosporosinus hippei DSM 8344]